MVHALPPKLKSSLSLSLKKKKKKLQSLYIEGWTIYKQNCGAKEFSHFGPLYTKLKAHAEEEEIPEDEQRKPKLPSSIAKDNPVGQP